MSNVLIMADRPMSLYHADCAISPTKLKNFMAHPPAWFKARYFDKTITEDDKPAFALGRYVHTLVLEGIDTALAQYAISPKFDRRTKQGKLDAEAFEVANLGKQLVTEDDHDLAERLHAAVRANPIACDLLAQGAPEMTFRHEIIAAMPLQCRPDWYSAEPCRWSDGYSYVVNLKTCDGINDFEKHAQKFGYFLSEAFARSVIADCVPDGRPTRHFFIVVDKQAPHGCAVFEADEITMDTARKVVTRQLAKLRECIETNHWPAAPEGISRVSAPEWWIKQNEG